ncbi:class I SAM-dependent methyltransferase [Micromonospora sp. NPDC093277]|uniref:class I SAM-dependent methyltransferase n=1 Tax=Micromonospora sp. NPDC093277 TaxID=3364291 RepID=UPI00382EE8EB
MPTPTGTLLAPFVAFRPDEFDGLRLARLPFVPEICLHLADDAIVLRARLEARVGPGLAPFWANAWAGGQALARYVLDHPQVVAGRRVLDVASGSGLVAIAAAKAGAAEVTANDIDPYALAAAAMNATANAVTLAVNEGDLLDGDGGLADVILAGDAFYDPELAARMLEFLHRAADRGARVLVGDPGRGHLPHRWLKVLTSYQVRGLGAAEDAELTEVSVLGPAG